MLGLLKCYQLSLRLSGLDRPVIRVRLKFSFNMIILLSSKALPSCVCFVENLQAYTMYLCMKDNHQKAIALAYCDCAVTAP